MQRNDNSSDAHSGTNLNPFNSNDMTIKAIQKKLTANGYSFIMDFSGKVIATKGQRTYSANSFNALYKIIFK